MRVRGFAAFPSRVTTSGIATQLKRSRVLDVSSTLVGSKHLYAKPARNARQINCYFKNKHARKKRSKQIKWIPTSSMNDTKCGSELNNVTPNNTFRQHAAMLLSEDSVFGMTIRPWRVGVWGKRIRITVELGRREMFIQQSLRSGVIIVYEHHG